ncbi:MAG: carbon storage regulator [Candidatus Solibacter sp.]
MQRREGESILIGDSVEIRILSIHGSRVKVGIAAPRSIPVLAREVQMVRAENLAAAALPSNAAMAMVASLFRQRPPETGPQTSNLSDKTA